MRISDWSSDVCSSDLVGLGVVMAGKEEDDIQVRRGRQRAATQPPQPQYDEPAAIDLAVDRFELRRRRLREREDRRSEARRVGKGGASTSGSRWSPYP